VEECNRVLDAFNMNAPDAMPGFPAPAPQAIVPGDMTIDDPADVHTGVLKLRGSSGLAAPSSYRKRLVI
jgi:hypothetical protein